MKKLHKADKIQTGAFGEKMEVALINDGPVTLSFESEPPKKKSKEEEEKKDMEKD